MNQTKLEPAPDTKEQSEQTKAAAASGARARVAPEFTNFPIPRSAPEGPPDRRGLARSRSSASRNGAALRAVYVAEVWLLKQ